MSAAKHRYPALIEELPVQPRLRAQLGDALAQGRVAHAYLFVGAPGSGKTKAAQALAGALVCPQGGCGSCDECIRVKHRTHPDVHRYAPGSATGYLVDQVRAIIDDVALAPVRGTRKVYVLERAEQLSASSANALLKTLEEPPASCTFILLASTADAVLPTIRSRCQVLSFELLSADAAEHAVTQATGASPEDARVALALTGSPERAAEYLRSKARQDVRRRVVQALSELSRMDEWEVLVAARELAEAVRVPLEDVKAAQEALAEQNSDFLTPAALKELEARNKRELSARERSGMMEAIASAESLLRDVLVRCEGAGQLVNADVSHVVGRLASSLDSTQVLRALDACSQAADDLAHNVSPQLTLEVWLLNIKEAYACPA